MGIIPILVPEVSLGLDCPHFFSWHQAVNTLLASLAIGIILEYYQCTLCYIGLVTWITPDRLTMCELFSKQWMLYFEAMDALL